MLAAVPILSALPSVPVTTAMSSNRGAAYDIVLLAHVLSAVVGFGAVGVAGVYALALRRAATPSESVRRYYRPGVNWAGRILFLVPVLGIALMVMGHGSWSFADAWIGIGLILWAAAAMAAEMVLWPAERALQQAVAADSSADSPEDGDPSPDRPGTDLGGHRTLCLRVAGISGVLLLLFVVSMVVMVAKP